MDNRNPADPSELPGQIRSDIKSGRGKLKIFFGYAAGVGKTYHMLETAQTDAINGVDVLIGYVEPHGRPETEALVLGLDILPVKIVEYQSVKLREFDLDAALSAHPKLIIVDELAHTNAPGSRHIKRWQDIEELRDAGIDVYTTVNVQHLESLNDIIAQITGVSVHETVPDTIFDTADEIEIVDLSQDELLERLRQGKVYVPAQAQRAMMNFFKKPNLIALRELALRRTADRINSQVQAGIFEPKTAKIRPIAERLLVCVGPSPTSAAVIRATKRLAVSLRADWIAVTVETPQTTDMSEKARQQLTKNIRLAEQLGAVTATLSGERVADEILECARSRNVTKIVLGKTSEPWWFLRRSIVNEVIRQSGDIDVYVIRGIEERFEPQVAISHKHKDEDRSGQLYALLAITIVTVINTALWYLGLREANLVMVYMLAVVFVAAKFGKNPAIWASIAAVITFDFFFVPPYLKFAVNDTQYFITFAVMLTIALITSTLTSRLKQQAELSRQREQRTESLYHLSRELAGITGRQQMLAAAEHRLAEIFAGELTIFLPDDSDKLRPMVGGQTIFSNNPNELAVAQWVFEHNQMAGRGTDTLPNAMALYVPLANHQGAIGVIGIRTERAEALFAPAQRQLLATYASQIALAIERDSLSEQAQKILVQAENERLRSSLLSSVSHDLKTPLAGIAGASSSLLEFGSQYDENTRKELLQTIYEESKRLTTLVENLLSMTRIESGSMVVNKQFQPVEEIVGSALGRVKKELAGRQVNANIPEDLPLVPVDGVLIEQVLINLLDNASKYTPAGTPIEIAARRENNNVVLTVADHGHGLAEHEKECVFEKFYRGIFTNKQGGAGLGLAICKAVMEAHGGRIWADNRKEVGACFYLSIPLGETKTQV